MLQWLCFPKKKKRYSFWHTWRQTYQTAVKSFKMTSTHNNKISHNKWCKNRYDGISSDRTWNIVIVMTLIEKHQCAILVGRLQELFWHNSHPYLTHPLGFAAFQTATKTEDLSRSKNRGESWSPRHKSRDLFRPNLKKSGWLASFNRGSLEAALCCCFPGTPGTARHSDVASWNEGHLEPGKPKAQRWILAINTHIEKTFLESIHQSLVPKINKTP